METPRQVVIIGAGMAGLVAARELGRAGVVVDLLEARTAVGGRVMSGHRPSWPFAIELGAEFVHGRPEPSLRLVNEASLRLQQLADRHHVQQTWAAPSTLAPQHRPELCEVPDFWQRIARVLSQVDTSAPDTSAAEFLASLTLTEQDRTLFELFVEGFHAAPLSDISLHALASDVGSSEGDKAQFRVAGGYGQLVQHLARGLDPERVRLHLGCVARELRWQNGNVSVYAERDSKRVSFSAAAAVITLPIGVLQAPPELGGITLTPEPRGLRKALECFGMSPVVKVVLRFAKPFWHPTALPQFEFLHTSKGHFPTFWLERQGDCCQVTAWAAAQNALRLGACTPAELAGDALQSLCGLLGAPFEQAQQALLAQHYHDFARDPFARGAYSHRRPGGQWAYQWLATPVEGTLFFAGEATDAEQPATVAGAIASGERAARDVLRFS
jgi:monoamine oxidase